MPVTKTRVVFTNDGDEGTAKRIVESVKKGNQVFVAEALLQVIKEDNGNFTIRNKDNTGLLQTDLIQLLSFAWLVNKTDGGNISQLQSASFCDQLH